MASASATNRPNLVVEKDPVAAHQFLAMPTVSRILVVQNALAATPVVGHLSGVLQPDSAATRHSDAVMLPSIRTSRSWMSWNPPIGRRTVRVGGVGQRAFVAPDRTADRLQATDVRVMRSTPAVSAKLLPAGAGSPRGRGVAQLDVRVLHGAQRDLVLDLRRGESGRAAFDEEALTWPSHMRPR